jgi:hypothetical protein
LDQGVEAVVKLAESFQMYALEHELFTFPLENYYVFVYLSKIRYYYLTHQLHILILFDILCNKKLKKVFKYMRKLLHNNIKSLFLKQ